jgi:hypothetical protein
MNGFFVTFTLLVAVACVISYALYLRYRRREFQHRERLAALEKGSPLPDVPEELWGPRSARIYLLRGMIWMFAGIAITAFLASISPRKTPDLESRLARAQNLKVLGATPEQIREADSEPAHNDLPGSIALLGLVPIGIGLAYLIYYRVEGKTTTPAGRGSA